MNTIKLNNIPHTLEYLIELVKNLEKYDQFKPRLCVETRQNLSFEEALDFMKDIGCSISKSKLYKLTSKHKIPCRYFGNRLVFNAEELLNWCESQLKSKDKLNSEATLAIVNDAQRKMFNCKNKKDGK